MEKNHVNIWNRSKLTLPQSPAYVVQILLPACG